MSFNATDFAFEGFRLARRAPLTILAWAAAYLVFYIAFFIVAGGTLVNILNLAQQVESSGDPTMGDISILGQAYGAMMALVLPLSLVCSAVLTAGVARAVMQPQEKRFGYLRFGRDELRILAATLIVGLMIFAVVMGGTLIISLFVALAESMAAPVLYLPAVLTGLGVVGVAIWLGVRFSLVVPIAFAEKKIGIKESWIMTKVHFWPLMGIAVLAGVMSILVGLLGSIIMAPMNLIFGGLDSVAGAETTNVLALASQFWPALLVWAVLNALMSAAQAGIIYAPFSAAYLGLKGMQRD